MSIMDDLRQRLKDSLAAAQGEDMSEIDALSKGEDGEKRKYYRRASLVDPSLTSSVGGGGYGPYRPRYSHISFKTLKEMSLRDPIVAAILQTRVNQVASFSRPQQSRYDTGFKVMPIDPSLEIKRGSPEEKEIKALTEFFLNTGLKENREPHDQMDFDTWLKLVVRDRLIYGSAAIETIRAKDGTVREFLPVPTETIYYANKAVSKELIDGLRVANKQSYFAGSEKQEVIDEIETETKEKLEKGEYEYVQVIDGRIVEGFTRQDMIYRLGNPQNFIDNNGYAIGELEMATVTITSHLQANNYNKLFFTHGFASRGMLHIKGDVTPSQLQAFRAQWYAQVAGNANSWRTPILAGVDDVQWVNLAASNKDMEYNAYIDHIIRTLCALFQIGPMEIGFDYLTKGSGTQALSESSNEWKIKESQDRGLRPLLVWLESLLNNDILAQAHPELAKKYKFCFVGLDAESKDQEQTRQQLALQIHSSLNDIRKEIDKDPILGGEMPLNQTYIEVLFKTHKISEIREKIFGYKADGDNEEYNYIADPFYVRPGAAGAVDEDGNPIGPDGLPLEVDENGNPIEPELDENGNPIEPIAQVGDGAGGPVEDAVNQYLQENPDVIDKSLLMKASNPNGSKAMESRFDKQRSDYIKAYDDIQRAMLEEIINAIKEETVDDDETDSTK